MQEIKRIIEQAVSDLYQKDKSLIDDEVHEQTISARIMYYLQNALREEWDIDVEYNRQGENRGPKTDTEGINRKPDIIIHKRGPKGPNLAVILVKCEWNTEPREDDKEVAQSIKRKHGYNFAFLLEIERSSFQLSEI